MSLGLAVCATGAALVPLFVAVAVVGRAAGLAVYVAALVAVLAAAGRRPDDHLPAPAATTAATVTADVILKAFDKAGFADAATVGGAAREGKGLNKRTRVLVELAPGRDSTATAVMKRREALAGNLRRDVRCVHLAEGAHPGQVIVTVLDSDPMAGPPVPSPLLTAASWSLWDPLPWGFDIRGNTVHLPLLWTSLLVGAKPRMGKTFAIRTICLAACLDRHARLYLWDGKGGGDYRAFQPACERWGQGHSARKGQPAACLEMLFEVSRLVADRNDRIDRLPTHLRPEGKLTREVAENPEYGLPLVVVVVDEVQRLVADPIHGDKIRDELIALAQNAPSCGVILVVGAQRPTQQTGTGSLGDLPPAMGSRAAFKVMDAAESNVILGNGHAGAGWDASQFPDAYEGVCLLRSGADVEEGPKGVQQVKTFYADDVMLESKMVEVVAARRPGASSGGLVLLDKPKVDDAKARLEALFNGGEDRASLDELADRAGVDRSTIRAWCREGGVKVGKIRVASKGPGATTDGVKRADVE
jgi:S-DNA-T family DNA segregation ATPase FtsK/SpoIIIE